MKIIVLLLTAVLLFACSDNKSLELKTKIEEKEATIKQISSDLRAGQSVPDSEREELEKLLTDFYKNYPADEYAPACLDKLHMIYSGKGDHVKSSEYGDLLIKDYPDYENRALILESLAMNYDFFISPRDTSKVRFYNELLLKENPNMPKEKADGIQFKLNNLDLSMEELILKMNQ